MNNFCSQLTTWHFTALFAACNGLDCVLITERLGVSCVEFRQSIDGLTSEVNQLTSNVNKLTKQLTASDDANLNQQFTGFLEVSSSSALSLYLLKSRHKSLFIYAAIRCPVDTFIATMAKVVSLEAFISYILICTRAKSKPLYAPHSSVQIQNNRIHALATA